MVPVIFNSSFYLLSGFYVKMLVKRHTFRFYLFRLYMGTQCSIVVQSIVIRFLCFNDHLSSSTLASEPILKPSNKPGTASRMGRLDEGDGSNLSPSTLP